MTETAAPVFSMGRLFGAVKNGQINEIKMLLLLPDADVDVKDMLNRTALSHACGESDLLKMESHIFTPESDYTAMEVVKVLVSSGANINNKDMGHYTPLILATAAGRWSIVEYLVAHGANVNITGGGNVLPSEADSLKMVKCLVSKGVNLNIGDMDGKTALMLACKHRLKSIVEFLLNEGADASKTDNEGETAKDEACREGSIEILKLLTASTGGAIATMEALSLAAKSGQLGLVKHFLSQGLGVNQANRDGWTPLMSASEGGYGHVLEYLIEQGANVNVCSEGYGETPLIVACKEGHPGLIATLLENGADVFIGDRYGRTALDYARGYLPPYRPGLVQESGRKTSKDCLKVVLEHIRTLFLASKDKKSLASRVKVDELVNTLIQHPSDKYLSNIVYHILVVSQQANCKIIHLAYREIHPVVSYGLNKKYTPHIVSHIFRVLIFVLRELLENRKNVPMVGDHISSVSPVSPMLLGNLEKPASLLKDTLELMAEFISKMQPKKKTIPVESLFLEAGGWEVLIPLGLVCKDDKDVLGAIGDVIAQLSPSDDQKVGECLVSKGVNLNIGDMDEKTPLTLACKHDLKKIVELLADETAKDEACPAGSMEMLQLLASNAPNKKVASIAPPSRRLKAMQQFLSKEAGGNVDHVDSYGWTPLARASDKGHDDVVEYLLSEGANVNVQSQRCGMTPLMRACEKGHLGVISKLLHHGADVFATDKYEKTALYRARCRTKTKEGVTLLLQHIEALIAKSTDRRSLADKVKIDELFDVFIEYHSDADRSEMVFRILSDTQRGNINGVCLLFGSIFLAIRFGLKAKYTANSVLYLFRFQFLVLKELRQNREKIDMVCEHLSSVPRTSSAGRSCHWLPPLLLGALEISPDILMNALELLSEFISKMQPKKKTIPVESLFLEAGGWEVLVPLGLVCKDDKDVLGAIGGVIAQLSPSDDRQVLDRFYAVESHEEFSQLMSTRNITTLSKDMIQPSESSLTVNSARKNIPMEVHQVPCSSSSSSSAIAFAYESWEDEAVNEKSQKHLKQLRKKYLNKIFLDKVENDDTGGTQDEVRIVKDVSWYDDYDSYVVITDLHDVDVDNRSEDTEESYLINHVLTEMIQAYEEKQM